MPSWRVVVEKLDDCPLKDEKILRVVSWNVNGAGEESAVWKYLLSLKPDIALLQEVGSIPEDVKGTYPVNELKPRIVVKKEFPYFAISEKSSTVVLAKGEKIEPLVLASGYKLVDDELNFFKGNLVACKLLINNLTLNVVSVHSPTWSLDEKWKKMYNKPLPEEIKQIKNESNDKVWVINLLLSALRNTKKDDEVWIVGGDLNSSETFDPDWQDKHKIDPKLWLRTKGGNKEMLDKIKKLGFNECLREFHDGQIVPTYEYRKKRNTQRGRVVHQMDHLFVTEHLFSKLKKCKVGEHAIVFGKPLSDHLPIIADFRVM